jgi:1,4-alpha-glucan branching enzyme
MSNTEPTEQSQAGMRNTVFKFHSEPGHAVYVAGTFNNWNAKQYPLHDRKGTGDYRLVVPLAPGRFEYKFIIDGLWCVDPECPDWVRNNYGSLNSVVTVDGLRPTAQAVGRRRVADTVAS